jgi:hypothetical protein
VVSNPPHVPVWLLDVDGVINTLKRPRWFTPPPRGYACADGVSWEMRWAEALIDEIRLLHVTGQVELRWCTTWCEYADQLEHLFGLPALVRAFPYAGDDAPALKFEAALAVVQDEHRPLIWTDDDAIPRQEEIIRPLLDARALLIRPNARFGLTRDDLTLITGWLAFHTPRGDARL